MSLPARALRTEAAAPDAWRPRLLPDRATLDAGGGPSWSPALRQAFATGTGEGLLALANVPAEKVADATVAYWRRLAREYLARFCQQGGASAVPLPDGDRIARWTGDAPPGPGMEYWGETSFRLIWQALGEAVARGVGAAGGDPDTWLGMIGPGWRQVGRVTFHLAEHPRSNSHPFAFLATYTRRLSDQGQLQHVPLGKAVRGAAGRDDRETLRQLLEPVHRAAAADSFVGGLVESGRVFQPLPWGPEDAYRFLRAIPALQEAGVVAKVPDWWEGGHPPRPAVVVDLELPDRISVGLGQLLSFKVRRALGGEELTDEEWERLLAAGEGLVFLRGKWVEVDGRRLEQALAHWRKVEEAAAEGRIGFAEGMRWLAGYRAGGRGGLPEETGAAGWAEVIPADRLRDWLEAPPDPGESPLAPLDGLRAELRPYQRAGVAWLHRLQEAGLGACLADDMGLGKTLQVIALFVALAGRGQAHLVVAPASLLGNWRSELERFAPGLRVLCAHRSALETGDWNRLEKRVEESDVVLTTYAMIDRHPLFAGTEWDLLVLDEAQAIKNPGARQTRAVKRLRARARVALTGTPVENGVLDLWSLFDFLNPGLLGTAESFREQLDRFSAAGYGPLRSLVAPFLLRRLKSDPGVAEDLPEKIELRTACALTRGQAALYETEVRHLAARLRDVAGDERERRGLVLRTLTRLKRVCDHPALLTGSGNLEAGGSGKMLRLRSLAAEIAGRGEKLLVFTQFREMVGGLAEDLETVFRRPGLVLHGGTPVGARSGLVASFQNPMGPPYVVVSLRAGGTGLNLTAANHVIHFDRWWNPAVENQATDRAYRIGQRKTVVVHKFVCPGTVEERIDAMLAEKSELAGRIVGDGGAEEHWSGWDDARLLALLALDREGMVS